MKRRVLSLALMLVIALALVPATALAADEDFVIENGILEGYNGPGGNVVIPSKVHTIGSNAFSDCTSLTGVTIHGGVSTIGKGAFWGCTNLASVTIPDSVNIIADHAFFCCSNLTSVTIGDHVARIGIQAFYGCDALTSLTVPSSVATIGTGAFWHCDSLRNITVEAGNPYYTSQDGVLFDENVTKLIQYPGGKEGIYTIPNSVTRIEKWAFCDCAGLTGVTVPSSVTEISSWGFEGCTNLTNVVIPRSVTKIDKEMFSGCDSLTEIVVAVDNSNYTSQDGVLFNKSMTRLLKYPQGRAGAYTIPNNVTEIENDAFYDCTGLTSVTIPSSVDNMEEGAFTHCTGLTSITLQASVTQIKQGVFSACENLAELTISGNVKTVGQRAFAYVESLKKVVLEPGVTAIEGGAFSGCANLQDITIPSTVMTVRGAFVSEKSQAVLHVAPGSMAETYAQRMGLHYVSDQPYVDVQTTETVTAYPSTQAVSVFGAPTTFQMYAIQDANGYLSNYIKLRDLAYIFQWYYYFDVEWDGTITVVQGKHYTVNGTEMKTPFSGERICAHGLEDVQIKGEDQDKTAVHTLDSLQIKDDQGNGYTYFKLRDLGELLGFKVNWDAAKGISIGQ